MRIAQNPESVGVKNFFSARHKTSVPSRSRSVGSELASTNDFKELPESEVKSLDNIPAEIRDKFDPMFATELSKIVRQKSQRRELLGFQV